MSTADIVEVAAGKLREELQPLPGSAMLPWRTRRTPYRVFLAEFLLVRTRCDVVARLFDDIVAHYPDVPSLARADQDGLAAILKPLGLRKRVPFLIKASCYISDRHHGEIPARVEDLLEVPGLGPYAAAAIAAFAFDAPVVPADVNVLRFLSRLTGLPMEHRTKGSKDLKRLLPLLSTTNGGPSPEVLLDFSRLVCRSRRPRCEECPLSTECTYFCASNQV